MEVHRGSNRGFTIVEVMFATMLLTVVGAAIASFLSATARSSEARRSVCDPALESALTVRRFKNIAPDFRHVLTVTPDEALVWLSDLVPSRSVHTSEAGLLRFDAAEGLLLLETVHSAYLDRNRIREREYLSGQYQLLAADLVAIRNAGGIATTIVAEGIEAVEFSPDPEESGGMRVTFTVDDYETTFLLAPAQPEEPIG